MRLLVCPKRLISIYVTAADKMCQVCAAEMAILNVVNKYMVFGCRRSPWSGGLFWDKSAALAIGPPGAWCLPLSVIHY